MTTVIGIDASLTGTGIARITLDPFTIATHTISSAGKKGATLDQRATRLRKLRDTIIDHATPADLAIIEGPSYASNTGSMWDRAAHWWNLVSTLHHLGVPVVEVAPARAKKFAADNGNADKTAVAAAMTRLWGDQVTPGNDNEFDALALATIGAIHLAPRDALPITILERHRHVVAGIWPKEDDDK